MIPRTFRRVYVLLSCTFSGLICGTLYLYSSYIPQIAKRLGYSVTDSCTIALCGTVGTALSSPLSGVLVDKKGYSGALLLGGASIIGAYYGLKVQFDLSYSSVLLSGTFLYLIGMGSTLVSFSSLKCCAISFPGIRGIATSLPLALYGLSAFFYSMVASVFFPGQVSRFLNFLIFSMVFILAVCAPSFLLCDKETRSRKTFRKHNLVEGIEMVSVKQADLRKSSSLTDDLASDRTVESGEHVLKSLNFWLVFLITGSLASIGQMYIYSVGYMTKALVTKNLHDGNIEVISNIDVSIQQNQQMQVALLSVSNFGGRIIAGVCADVISRSGGMARTWLLLVPTIGSVVTQIVGNLIDSYSTLIIESLLVGAFYGFTFCIMPIIVGDLFGMEDFTFNWGIVCLAPFIPSFILTTLFGKIFDSNSSKTKDSDIVLCLKGKLCYNSIFQTTILFSVFSLFLAIFLIRNLKRSSRIVKMTV